MKNLFPLITISLTLFVWSCGGGPEKSTSDSKEEKSEKAEEYSIDTQEGMMKKVNEYGIDLHESLAFLEVSKSSGEYTGRFIAEGLDESSSIELAQWFDEEKANLISNGWKQSQYGNIEGDTLVGIVTNSYIFFKQKEGSSRKLGLQFSSNYNIETKTFKAFITPN